MRRIAALAHQALPEYSHAKSVPQIISSRSQTVKLKGITAIALAVILGTSAHAEAPRLSISLDKVLATSLDTSDLWKSARSAAAVAHDQVLAQRGSLLPHLSVDGYYRYVTVIPAFSVAPGAPSIAFTTHNQYSIGPTVSW